ELTIEPGQTITARVVVERNGTESRIELGNESSGRNLPHGAFVDNIGLNGLLIPEGQTQREFFITAAPKVAPGRRQFHLRSATAGNPTSRPIWLNVVSTIKPDARAQAPRTTNVDLVAGKTFVAHDTLAIGLEAELDARKCLEGLAWVPKSFEVTLQTADEHQGDLLVRFPSARPVGDATNDLAAMEWYQAVDEEGFAIEAPAAVIVHESGSGMTVGRLIAKSLRSKGIHTFMLQLPYYGVRREAQRPQGVQLIEALSQSIADARRARDAVAALPLVDNTRISLQGTSLGGFVVATTAGLDRGYHNVFILLAGGDLADVLTNGKKDAQKVRQAMMAGGMGDVEFRTMLSRIEPLRLAHRIDADRTWLFSGSYDDVVPTRNSDLLATAANLPEGHHAKLLANHYTGIIFLPMISQQMSQHIRE
ncbi:MAG: hypothetical protein ABI557_07665, partial [Aureliella sp.]